MNKKDKEIKEKENLKTADKIAEYASKSRDAYDAYIIARVTSDAAWNAWDITRVARDNPHVTYNNNRDAYDDYDAAWKAWNIARVARDDAHVIWENARNAYESEIFWLDDKIK